MTAGAWEARIRRHVGTACSVGELAIRMRVTSRQMESVLRSLEDGDALREQIKGNARRKRLMKAFGEEKSVPEWAADPRCVVTLNVLSRRVEYGWEPEQALTVPKFQRNSARIMTPTEVARLLLLAVPGEMPSAERKAERDALVRSLLTEKVTIAQISRDTGINYPTVREWARRTR